MPRLRVDFIVLAALALLLFLFAENWQPESEQRVARSLAEIKRQIGFDLIFVTTAKTDDEGRALLAELGMPFRDLKKDEPAEGAAA